MSTIPVPFPVGRPQLLTPRDVQRGLRLNRYIQAFPTPKQAAFLFLPQIEAFYGGAGGGGKSVALLMGALQYVDVPNYAALLLRRSYSDLALPGALMDMAQDWLGGTDAHWSGQNHTWSFPTGGRPSTLSFGYLENERDKYRYRSAAFQYCVAKGTLILLANGSYRPIEQLEPGEWLTTLEGPRQLLRKTLPELKPCYEMITPYASTIVSATHAILTEHGWVSPLAQIAMQSRVYDNMHATLPEPYAVVGMPYSRLLLDLQPVIVRAQRRLAESLHQASVVCSADTQNDCAAFVGVHPRVAPLLVWNVPGVLHAPSLRQAQSVARHYASAHGYLESLHTSCDIDYHGAHDWHDGCARRWSANVPDNIQRRDDVGTSCPQHLRQDDQDYIHGHSPLRQYSYAHPYTMERKVAGADVHLSSVAMRPAGVREVFDLTVHQASHYISFGGIISQNCGFDELTGFTESQYTYLFSRLRRLEGFPVPIRMRSASNPGDAGHGWVKDRFIIRGAAHGRPFIPARIIDNPYLDVSSYRDSLSRLDPLTRAQMEAGDWDAAAPGELFQRHWFRVVGDYPRSARMVRFWDLAATEVMTGLNLDPDYTAGMLMAFHNGQYWIVDVKRARLSPKKVEDLISQTAKLDGRHVDVWIEQEPGASGKLVISDYQRNVLPGFTVRGLRNSGSKSERARPISSAAEAGNVFMVHGAWNEPFLDEVVLFPSGPHDDQVDAMSGASIALTERKGRVVLL